MPNIYSSLTYRGSKQDNPTPHPEGVELGYTFLMNGYLWGVRFVHPTDPFLMDRTNELRLATTDPATMTVYLSTELSGELLMRVLTHELGHCCMFSYGLLQELHEIVPPDQWIEAEEWVCNFVADYGREITNLSDRLLSKFITAKAR